VETHKALKALALDLADWVVAVVRQWLYFLFGAFVSGVYSAVEHYSGRSVTWSVYLWVAFAAFMVAAFQAWRFERHEVIRQRDLLEALGRPDLEHTVIKYLWTGDVKGGAGVLVELWLINVGDATKVGDWEMALALTSDEIDGEIGVILAGWSAHDGATKKVP
jgi:hypothetical protein